MTQARAYRVAILHSLGDTAQLGLENSYSVLATLAEAYKVQSRG